MESGAMGVLPALASKNPDMLRGFGLIGNVAANKMDDREEKKKTEAAAAGAQAMKKGGSVNENAMMKKMGRGLTKAAMQKVASKVVKGHEKRMHGMKSGGSVSASKRADGIAMKGKTKGRMV
jgi:hypothetical protein